MGPQWEWQRPLTRPSSNSHSEIHTEIFTHTFGYICTRAIFPTIFFLLHFAVLCVQPKQEKMELCKIQASVIFIYERHWTGPENG